MTIDELLDRFEREYQDLHSISSERRVAQGRLLRKMALRLNGRSLVGMTAEDIVAYMGSRIKDGIHPNTVQKERVMIGSFCTWAHKAALIDDTTILQIKAIAMPRGAGIYKPKPYKPIEIRQLYTELERKYPLLPLKGNGSQVLKRYYQGKTAWRRVWRHSRRLQWEAMISLALEEGLRRVELGRATIPEIHPDNLAVVVRGAKGRPGEDKTREVPFTSHSRECVREWLDFRETLGPPHDGPWLSLHPYRDSPLDRLGKDQLDTSFQYWEGPWAWHRLRHTFATERLRAGMKIEKLRIVLGHANIEHTLLYTEILNEDTQEEAERTEGEFAAKLGFAA